MAQHSCVFHCIFRRLASGSRWIRAGMCRRRIYLRCMVRVQLLFFCFNVKHVGGMDDSFLLTTRPATSTRWEEVRKWFVQQTSHTCRESESVSHYYHNIPYTSSLMSCFICHSLIHSYPLTCVMCHTSLIHTFMSQPRYGILMSSASTLISSIAVFETSRYCFRATANRIAENSPNFQAIRSVLESPGLAGLKVNLRMQNPARRLSHHPNHQLERCPFCCLMFEYASCVRKK